MVSYNPRQPNPSTSNPHPLPTVIHSPHPPHRSSHMMVPTNTIVIPKIPTFFYRYHHYYHTLSILLYQRWSFFISIISTIIYMIPIFITSIVISVTWKDSCNRVLHAYLYGVLLHTILSLFCYIIYLRKSSHPTILLSTSQHVFMLIRWLVTLGSMIWMIIGTYWISTSKPCKTISPLLYYTSLLLIICFYISHLITWILTLITCWGFRRCMKKLSLYEHSEGVLRGVPVKVYESDPSHSPSHCHLCLTPYNPTQQLRQFSTCHHSFHRLCTEQWLSLCTTCPICHVSAFYDTSKKNEQDDGTRARFEASLQGPVSEASRGRATTQMMVSHDETTPTRTTPHPASTSHSSGYVSHDEVDLFMNPVMNALQVSQDQLRTRPDIHHKSQQSVPPSQIISQHLRPPAPRGSQTHRPSLIRSMSNPTGQWDASHPVLRTMSDPIGRQEKAVEDDLPPYDYDSDEESRDIVRLRRLRSFAKHRPAFIRPLPKPRSATEPNTPRDRKPFTLPSVPGSRNDSDEENTIEIMDEIPGQAPGNMVITRYMMMDITLSPIMKDPRTTRRIMTQPSSPRTHPLHVMIDMEDDDPFIEKPDPVLNTTPHNILMQQMAGYRVRRTLSIEGIAEAKASEERIQQMKQTKQRHDEMVQLKSFAQQLKNMKIPTFQQPKRAQPPPPPTPPQTYQPQSQQQQQQQKQQPPQLPQIPQHQQSQQPSQQEKQQQQHHHPSQYQPQSRVPQRPHAQTMDEPYVKSRNPFPTYDPRIPQQRQHAHTVTQYDVSSQHRSNHVSSYPEMPSRQHSKSQWTPSPHFQPPPPPLPPPQQQPYQPSYQEYS